VLSLEGGRCEDCDRMLEGDTDGMDCVMMDGGDDAFNHMCRGCRRQVCDLCSMDRQGRVCLECATGSLG